MTSGPAQELPSPGTLTMSAIPPEAVVRPPALRTARPDRLDIIDFEHDLHATSVSFILSCPDWMVRAQVGVEVQREVCVLASHCRLFVRPLSRLTFSGPGPSNSHTSLARGELGPRWGNSVFWAALDRNCDFALQLLPTTGAGFVAFGLPWGFCHDYRAPFRNFRQTITSPLG